jgi:hypothetical protein
VCTKEAGVTYEACKPQVEDTGCMQFHPKYMMYLECIDFRASSLFCTSSTAESLTSSGT